jgi:hypothetical protein
MMLDLKLAGATKQEIEEVVLGKMSVVDQVMYRHAVGIIMDRWIADIQEMEIPDEDWIRKY